METHLVHIGAVFVEDGCRDPPLVHVLLELRCLVGLWSSRLSVSPTTAWLPWALSLCPRQTPRTCASSSWREFAHLQCWARFPIQWRGPWVGRFGGCWQPLQPLAQLVAEPSLGWSCRLGPTHWRPSYHGSAPPKRCSLWSGVCYSRFMLFSMVWPEGKGGSSATWSGWCQ